MIPDKSFTLTENGLTLEIKNSGVDTDDENYFSIMGGMDSNPTWEEYLSQYMDEYKPHVNMIRKAIEELGWIGTTGEDVANYNAFCFSDGTVFGFSWRAWGDIMQAIVGKKEGYMKYYM